MKKYWLIFSHLGIAATAFWYGAWSLPVEVSTNNLSAQTLHHSHINGAHEIPQQLAPEKLSPINDKDTPISIPTEVGSNLGISEALSFDDDGDDIHTESPQTDDDILVEKELEFSLQEGESSEAWQNFHDHIVAMELTGIAISHLECRSASCRLELSTDDHVAQERFLSKIGLPPFDQGGFFFRDDTGEHLVVFAKHLL